MKKQQWVLQSLTYRRQKKTFLQSGHFIDEKQVHLNKARYWLFASSTLLGFFSHKEILIFSGCGSSEPQLLIHCNQIFISFDFFLHCFIHTNARQLSVSLVGGGGAAPAVLSASLGNPHASQKQVSWHGRVNCQELHQPCTGVSTRKGQRQSASPSTWLQLSWRD